MGIRFFFFFVVVVFLGLNIHPVNSSFERDPEWGTALGLVKESPKLGDADPTTVLNNLAETHGGVSNVLEASEFGLLEDFISSTIKTLGASVFVEKSNSLESRNNRNLVRRPVVEPVVKPVVVKKKKSNKKKVSIVHPISGVPMEVTIKKKKTHLIPGMEDSFDNKSVPEVLAELIRLQTNNTHY
ncbi:MAG: hypothetical protein GY915_05690 [bacterium]|nr:hypothetical protein [bacterium]